MVINASLESDPSPTYRDRDEVYNLRTDVECEPPNTLHILGRRCKVFAGHDVNAAWQCEYLESLRPTSVLKNTSR